MLDMLVADKRCQSRLGKSRNQSRRHRTSLTLLSHPFDKELCSDFTFAPFDTMSQFRTRFQSLSVTLQATSHGVFHVVYGLDHVLLPRLLLVDPSKVRLNDQDSRRMIKTLASRSLSTTTLARMSLYTSIVTPNKRQIDVPTGLFINNEFVPSVDSNQVIKHVRIVR
jgi:hypothetical protein